MMDQVGLDTVENIENHYIKERGLARSHVDWLHKNYIVRTRVHLDSICILGGPCVSLLREIR